MKVETLSGIYVEVSERDAMWIKWIDAHGVSSKSIREFLSKYPPSSPTAEVSDLKSDKCEFKSHDGDE